MKVIQQPPFIRATKRLHKAEKQWLDAAIRQIMATPDIGEAKKWNLAGVRVYKFRVHDQLKLLSYCYGDDTLTLLYYGSHENFYRDLKN